jgi:F0F1-type ATP synthase assembly protein I
MSTEADKIQERARQVLERAEAKRQSQQQRGQEREQRKQDQRVQRVAVVDIQMPFMSMVTFMIKWALASVPAFLILMFLVGMVWILLHGPK